jgi:hypothetical protein
LTDLRASGLDLTQETMDKGQQEENDTIELRKNIKRLEAHVKLDKNIKIIIKLFVDHVMVVSESNANVKRDFYTKYFKLQEHTLQISILYKKNLHWKETQDKTYDQLDFIKKFHKIKG